jgi:ribonuclease P protein component
VLLHCKAQGYFISYLAKNSFIKPVFTLQKHERLKSRKVLEQLFRDGSSFFVHPFKVYYRTSGLPEEIKLQAGFGVSSRLFKRSVDRNRIKRLMREAYRLQKIDLQQTITSSNNKLAVFFLYTAKDLPDFVLVKEKMKSALQKLHTLMTQ